MTRWRRSSSRKSRRMVTAANAMVKIIRLQQISGGFVRRDGDEGSRLMRLTRKRTCWPTP
jgi:hypothetical protein